METGASPERAPGPLPSAARAQRLVIGLLTLLLTDIIWVASSELTEYIFKTQKYNKPFFSTYLKTSLFMLYLPGFLVHRPWREQCLEAVQLRRIGGARTGGEYRAVTESDTGEEEEALSDTGDSDIGGEGGTGLHSRNNAVARSLSEPTFQPIRSEGTDSEADTGNILQKEGNPSVLMIVLLGNKRVRFNRVAEVRSMSAKEAIHANLARLSYAASMRAQAALERAQNRLTVGETAWLALTFSLLWFAGNYSYQAALAHTEAGVVNVLSASSCLFTLILSAIFPSGAMDSLSLTKMLGVLSTMSGVVLVSYSDLKMEDGFPIGALWTLAGSLFYSSYIVFLRRKIDHEDKLDVPMFFGFVGVFSFLSLWPLFFIFHFTNHERFEMPNKPQLVALLLNGVIGTVLSELLWLFGCFYTSSLIATLSISLTIPLTTFADVLVKRVEYDNLFYIGSIPMFVSFFLVAMVSHWNNWDPVMEGLQVTWARLCRCCNRRRESGRQRRRIVESLESEGLLTSEADENEDSSHLEAA